MTDHFEVLERDGAARLGELRLADPVATPALVGEAGVDDDREGVHAVLDDAGSRWREAAEAPEGDPARLTVLPHRATPRGTPDEVAAAFGPEPVDVDFPAAAVVSPATATDLGVDAYVLSGGPGYDEHARAFVDGVVAVREAVPPDTALYLAGAATPANAAALAYAGVDLVDADRALVRGRRGFYQTVDGEQFLEDLEELPCSCPACRRPREAFTREHCAEHNVAALSATLSTVRHRIRRGRLRDYLEAQGRHEAFGTAVLRLLDDRWGYLEPRTPVLRRNSMLAASDDALRRVEIRRFADRVTDRYVPRFADRPAVLVPCSATKPYGDSASHGRFHDAIDFRAHKVSMTSPIGVVPQELELTYPAQHYDAVVTDRWSASEVEFVAEVLARYLERADYPRVVAHLPGAYRPVTDRVADELGVEFTHTVADHPTDDASLSALSDVLEGLDRYRKREREHNTVRAVADYQFGPGAGDELFGPIATEGRYPSLRVRAGSREDPGDQLATLVPSYGVLSLTLAGARRWVASGIETLRVDIDDFVPSGSVLAPGVLDASDAIRVGDEVVVEGPSAFAVGRAAMAGPEMADATRGVAVDVRHTEERAT